MAPGIAGATASPCAFDAGRNAELVGQHYDKLDHFYRIIWGTHVHHGLWRTGRETLDEARQGLVRFVVEEAGIRRGDTVCDVGCGYGETARMLARDWGARVTGLTVSRAQTAYAQSIDHGPESPKFLCRNWLENDLPEASFDVVLAIESTEHMPNRAQCLEEMARVLKPGGRAIVCTWLAQGNAGTAAQSLLLGPLAAESHMQPLETESEYRAHFRKAGLTLSSVADLSKNVQPTWPRTVGRFLRALTQHPTHVRFLVNEHHRNRIFALTTLRIWIAFQIGTLHYGVFTATRTGGTRSGRS